MKYKLSNIASKTSLELTFGIPLKYPNVYKPRLTIDGLKEQSIPIITMDAPKHITKGIWGILPQDFEGDWKKFQKIKTTLHTNKNDITNNVLYREALQKRRYIYICSKALGSGRNRQCESVPLCIKAQCNSCTPDLLLSHH